MSQVPDHSQSSSSSSSSAYTPFRQAEKHFKSRAIPHTTPSLPAGILDLSRPRQREDDEVWLAGWWGPPEDEVGVKYRRRKGKERARGERGEDGSEGLEALDLGDGKLGYLVSDGCILIPGYLDPEQQLDLLTSALSEYTLPPNPLSLSTHYDLPPDLFELSTRAPTTPISSLFTSLSEEEQAAIRDKEAQLGHRSAQNPKSGAELRYSQILERGRAWEGDTPGSRLGERTAGELIKELRWANLGWVYRWTTKEYDFDTDDPIPFPPGLGDMCSRIVRSIPWDDVFADKSLHEEQDQTGWQNWKNDYRPDSGIVNFYQMKDTLMAHADRAELDPYRPLVSVSLGHAAIFLLGSSTRDTAPEPIILRSGDVLIMSGKGRQAYHGVPRIMEGTLPAHFAIKEGDTDKQVAVKKYIQTARVNINARQVFPPGFKR